MLEDFLMIVGGLGSNINSQTAPQKDKCEKYIRIWNRPVEDLKEFILSHQVKLWIKYCLNSKRIHTLFEL